MKWKFQRSFLFVAILLNAILCLYLTWLSAGYANTPFGTHDSAGRPLGFNDHLSAEHYLILLRNADLSAVFKALGWIGTIIVLTHFAALISIACSLPKFVRSLFKLMLWGQFALLPIGFLAIFLIPFVLGAFVSGAADGEVLSDGVPMWWLVVPSWLILCVMVLATKTGEGLQNQRA